MTNLAIIEMEKSLAGITEECHTYIGWKRRGYKVNPGQKAVIVTRLWKRFTGRNPKGYVDETDDVVDEKNTKSFYTVKAFLFKESQVSKIVTNT